MKSQKKERLSFEQSLKRLEEIITKLEQGTIPLEESLQLFEEGISLTRMCSTQLQEAKQKIELLMQKNGMVQEKPFTPTPL